jgi:hypothetical protein
VLQVGQKARVPPVVLEQQVVLVEPLPVEEREVPVPLEGTGRKAAPQPVARAGASLPVLRPEP